MERIGHNLVTVAQASKDILTVTGRRSNVQMVEIGSAGGGSMATLRQTDARLLHL